MTHEELKKRLVYNPETGEFLRILKDGTLKPTGEGLCGAGYMRVGIGQGSYLAHRLAWFYHYGEWPKQRIDHINEVRYDNRISNLRDVSPSINGLNSSKTKGYTYSKKGKKWFAQITLDREHNHLGSFETEEEARLAYLLCVDLIMEDLKYTEVV